MSAVEGVVTEVAPQCSGSRQPFQPGTLSRDHEVAKCPACLGNWYVQDDGNLEQHPLWPVAPTPELRTVEHGHTFWLDNPGEHPRVYRCDCGAREQFSGAWVAVERGEH